MTREEAVCRLYSLIGKAADRISYDEYLEMRKCARLLTPPVPDPETGLCRCGCGGEPDTLVNVAGNLYGIECKNCFTGTDLQGTEKGAIKDWNRAMGWEVEV